MSTRVPPRDAIRRFSRGVKRRLFWVALAFGIGGGLTWTYREAVFRLVFAPAGGSLSPFGGLPTYTEPTEMFSATIGLAMKGGLVVAFPVATYICLRALAPMLPPQHRRFLWLFPPVAIVCFLGGAAFAYFVMLPVGLRFLLHFGDGIAIPLIRISAYMSLISSMVLWIGIVFDLPPAMFLLAKLRLISRQEFRRFRRHVPIAALIFGMLLTPTGDWLNQTMVAVPIIVLYEVGLVGAWLAEGGHRTCARKAWAAAVGLWRRLLHALARLRAWLGSVCRKALTKAAFWRRG